jgi:hypothetical protein
MNMPTLAIVFGLLLDGLALAGFVATGSSHLTALIPGVFGTLLLVTGIISKIHPGIRMHLMHVAALVGLLGTAGGLGMGLPKISAVLAGTAARPLAVWLQIGMGVLCLIFVVLCVKSFIAARKARKAQS